MRTRPTYVHAPFSWEPSSKASATSLLTFVTHRTSPAPSSWMHVLHDHLVLVNSCSSLSSSALFFNFFYVIWDGVYPAACSPLFWSSTSSIDAADMHGQWSTLLGTTTDLLNKYYIQKSPFNFTKVNTICHSSLPRSRIKYDMSP